MPERPVVFVSYARVDRAPVRNIVDELRNLGIVAWVDADQLVAGESWTDSIGTALQRASAVLVFISPDSMRSRHIAVELDHALEKGVRILPILLRPTPVDELPYRLRTIQWLDVSRYPANAAAAMTAREIYALVSAWSQTPTQEALPDSARKALAEALAAQTRGKDSTSEEEKAPDSVFVVHGHDEEFLDEVVAFVRSVGVTPIVMKEAGGAVTSLIEKFFEIGGAARFAIVLLSGDDMGASRLQYDENGVGERALKFRSRQNVILELGYFYGLLGWDSVFVLEKEPSRRFPDFERPSDLNGVLFDRYDKTDKMEEGGT